MNTLKLTITFLLCFVAITAVNSFANDEEFEIDLINFQQQRIGQQVHLAWQTQMEKGTEKFIIEHSVDGLTFQQKDSLIAAGRSEKLLNYTYKDLYPKSGLNFYRLKQVFKDGTSEVSRVLMVNIYLKEFFSNTYPNPTYGELFLNLPSELEAEEGALRITNSIGKLVWEQKILIENGAQYQMNFQSYGLPEGIYQVTVTTQQKIISCNNISFIR